MAQVDQGVLNCPDCRQALDRVQWHGIAVEVCGSCHGMWLDSGELCRIEERDTEENIDRAFVGDMVRKSLKEADSELASETKRTCPRDEALLARKEWNWETHLVFDYCGVCGGMWLDAGELEGYVAFMKDMKEHPVQLSDAQREELREQRLKTEREIQDFVDAVDWGPLSGLVRMLDKIRKGLGG